MGESVSFDIKKKGKKNNRRQVSGELRSEIWHNGDLTGTHKTDAGGSTLDKVHPEPFLLYTALSTNHRTGILRFKWTA